MSQIKKLLSDKQDVISHTDVLKKFDWIISKNRNCILSPDSDGLMCGLLMSKLLNWKIKGFYDGKILLYDKNIIPSECIFLGYRNLQKKF